MSPSSRLSHHDDVQDLGDVNLGKSCQSPDPSKPSIDSRVRTRLLCSLELAFHSRIPTNCCSYRNPRNKTHQVLLSTLARVVERDLSLYRLVVRCSLESESEELTWSECKRTPMLTNSTFEITFVDRSAPQSHRMSCVCLSFSQFRHQKTDCIGTAHRKLTPHSIIQGFLYFYPFANPSCSICRSSSW